MISYKDALSKILACAETLGTEDRPLADLLGSYLAEPIQASGDMPLFDNSAVDGYGVIASDLQNASGNRPVTLCLAGEIQAGDRGELDIASGEAIKILTGATVPKCVESMVMKEFCEEVEGNVVVRTSARPGDNIRRRGEEFKKGQEILAACTEVTPPVVGLVASVGNSFARVYRRPKVSILGTGNELVAPGTPLAEGKIYDSNSYALAAACRALGVEQIRTNVVSDERNATRQALANCLFDSDVVICAGGVSVGDYDFVKDVLEELKVHTEFWKIAIKPGKPVYFGTQETGYTKRLVFGLPGNPVSALVTFHLFVKPALQKMMGAMHSESLCLKARLVSDLKKKAGRMEFVRGKLRVDDGSLIVFPTTGQGSHMLGGLAGADCFIHFPQDEASLSDGDTVIIEPVCWYP